MRAIAWHDAALDPPRADGGGHNYYFADASGKHLMSAPVLGVYVNDLGVRRYAVCSYLEDGRWYTHGYRFISVTHWTPLPKMPKEGEHET